MSKLLVIDDTLSSLQLMAYLLRAFGHEVDATASSTDGLARALSGPYDAIVTDVLMPEMDGYELLRRFREARPDSPPRVIAVTALAMVGDKEQLLDAGFDGYIAKPIDPENFVLTVEGFLPRHDSRPSVLAVDDLSVNLDVLEHTLQPFGFRVVRANSVPEAIAAVQRERPALILCDVHMPGGNGYELIEYVKNDDRLRDVPVFVMSSTAWKTSDRQRAMNLGADRFILRPIEPEALLDAVRSAVGS